MRKLTILLTLLTLSAELWAQTQSVTYIDENGVAQTVTATVITNSTTTLNAGWYVVTGTDVRTGSLTCNGEVHLILADGAKLSVTGAWRQAGIQVSGDGNFLTIYGQTAQSGQLIATGGDGAAGIGGGDSGSGSNITINGGIVTATGGDGAAGIGGGYNGSGSNITINGGTVWTKGGVYAAGIGGGNRSIGSYITINGGMVTATGGVSAAGIGGGRYSSGSNITINSGNIHSTGGKSAAGIGGGQYSFGSNITINGGMVTATGGEYGSGIGGGEDGSGSDIFMPDNYRIKADGSFIHNDGTDLAGSLAGKQYVEAYPDGLLNERNAAFAAISAAVEGIADEAILAMAAAGMEDVFQAEVSGDIEASKQKTLSDLQYVISFYNSGKAAGKAEGIEEGKAEALGTMGEPCEDCPAIDVKKGTTTIRLYSPEKVEFKKME